MRDYKLANVLLDPGDFAESAPGLFWRVVEGEASYDAEAGALRVRGAVDFTTYLNSLSIEKWRRYTCVTDASVALSVSGDRCAVRACSLVKGKKEPVVAQAPYVSLSSEGISHAEVPLLAAKGALVVGFRVESEGETMVHAACYQARVPEGAVRDVRLALATTTFRKEPYIERNIELVKEHVLAGPESLAGHFHMFVVDNGRTLNAAALSTDDVTVVPNPNVGGSGGFARGMMEAEDWGATHVILMDDDVRILPESLSRTYAVLALRNSAYEHAFLSGAMLNLEDPGHFFEDASRVIRGGIYQKVKPDLDVTDPLQALAAESIDVEVKNAYAAWWYCCIPMEAVREHGLPLPFFIRCDDVEFGIRNQPTIMCMNGICVWHERFEGRFRASVDCYQYQRNFLIMDAVSELGVRRAAMARFDRTFHIFLRAMAYDVCDLMLDGFEDFLKGPSFLEEADGEALMRAKGAKNERLVPLDELSPEDRALADRAKPDLSYFGDERNRHLPMKLLEQLPHDRHLLPDSLLSDEPGPIYYSRGGYPARRTMRRKTLVAYDVTGKAAHVRHMDRTRWEALNERFDRVMREMRERGDEVAQQYRDAMPRLTSRAFWEEYLAKRA